MFCTNCGKQNPEGANFCYNCGMTMTKEVPSPTDPVWVNNEPTEEPVMAEMPEQELTVETDPPKRDGKKGMAIAGLVFSVVGLAISVICCIYFGSMILGIVCSAVGIVLCSMSMKSSEAATIAVTGLIIGIIGVIIGVMMLIFFLAMLTTDTVYSSFFDGVMDEFLYQ